MDIEKCKYYDRDGIALYNGECREIMSGIPDKSVDTIITDPPYALEFMGKGWDKVLPDIEVWRECLRIAKPGAMLMAFGGTRTYHRLTCAIEDAGWEIRDCIMWVYGSGFPKSQDISKAIDKAAGAERVKIPNPLAKQQTASINTTDYSDYNAVQNIAPFPATPEDQTWEGYGTALKPSYEPIVLAMKPLDGTFAQNALKWGVGGLWIDGGRVGTEEMKWQPRGESVSYARTTSDATREGEINKGRWPANLIHDGSDEVMRLFPETKSSDGGTSSTGFWRRDDRRQPISSGDSGSAARFFYCAKASKAERGEGNSHPTVKPLALMEYLCKLTKTPEDGIVCDPFVGSGTTLVAAKRLGRKATGIEMDQSSCEIAVKRLDGDKIVIEIEPACGDTPAKRLTQGILFG